MANSLTADGLTVKSTSEILSALITAYQSIYGTDINVGPNSPDGQSLTIVSQAIQDNLQLLTQVYNSFSLQNAFGVVLDQRVAMSGIIRNGGSYTQVYVQVTSTAALTISGQDALASNPSATVFTVQDTAGNQYQLSASYVFTGAATVTLKFVAVDIGQLQVTAGTIQNISTVTPGITAVSNPSTLIATTCSTNSNTHLTAIPSTASMTVGMLVVGTNIPTNSTLTQIVSSSEVVISNAVAGSNVGVSITVSTPVTVEGEAEETDPQLKIRQANSYFLQSQGPADAVRAALLATPGVIDAYVAENITASTALGVPAHGIWVIVNSTATAQAVGTAIYKKKGAGCAVTGAQSYTVVRPAGNTQTMLWDNALPENLYIEATLFPRIPGQTFDVTTDGASLASALVYKLGQQPNVGDVVNALATIEPLAIVTSCQVSSDGVTWEQILTPSDYQHFFVTAASRITLVNA